MDTYTTESLRLFFALWPDDATRTALVQLQAPMQGRIVPYGNLHLTLAFLGQQPATVLADAQKILTHLSTPTPTLVLDRLGYFTRNRIAWIGSHATPPGLPALQQELTNALIANGISFNNQPSFKPHITLARDASLPPDITFDPLLWRADRVALVQSITDVHGSAYRVLASRSLDVPCWVAEENSNSAARN